MTQKNKPCSAFNKLISYGTRTCMMAIFAILFSGNTNATTCTCNVGEHMVNGQCEPCGNYSIYYCPGECKEVRCPTPDFDWYANYYNGKVVRTSHKVASHQTFSEMDCYTEALIDIDVGRIFIQYSSDEAHGLYKRKSIETYISVNPGYYLSNLSPVTIWSYKHYDTVLPCTNDKPANSHYTSEPNLTTNDCPWECDDGYGHTSDDRCLPLCRIGETAMNGINIYAEKHTKYAMAVPRMGSVCWISTTRNDGGKLVPIN